jgi:hypothetical protein
MATTARSEVLHTGNYAPATEGRPVVRAPEDLHLHPALEKLDLIDLVHELNNAARVTGISSVEPVLIASDGTILSGFGQWRLAILESRSTLNCIEYSLDENDSLRSILAHHQRRRGWNPFVRIRLALTLESALQKLALANMSEGGKLKGLAKLPRAEHIDVRQLIADHAGVGARNVANVKVILKTAHPRILQALRDGVLSINRAVQLCKLPKVEQLQRFTEVCSRRAINKSIRASMPALEHGDGPKSTSVVLDMLQQQELREPGSVKVRIGTSRETVVLVGQDFLTRVPTTVNQQ